MHQCTLNGHVPVTGHHFRTLQTWEHPTGAELCEMLWLSNPVITDWLVSDSIKSPHSPLFPVSSINFDVLNLLKNISDVPWWKDNPCSLHLSAVIILFRISVERQKTSSNSSLPFSFERSCFKRNTEHCAKNDLAFESWIYAEEMGGGMSYYPKHWIDDTLNICPF